jgi:5-methylcytosine-specific restriction endonuclease McrBC GTP-binding regulatory subunit McrB
MNEVDLNWPNTPIGEIKTLENIDNSFFKTPFLGSKDLSEEDRDLIKEEISLLIQVNKILEKSDLHFAYRVRDEVAFYLILNKKNKLMDSYTAMDFQLVQKVLPRIHGSSERVQLVLVELLNLLEGKEFKSNGFEYANIEGQIDFEKLKYKRATKKILFMLKRFEDDRFTSFWL